MRKIDKLIFQAVIPPFLIALSILTFIVFVVQIGDKIINSASLTTIGIISAAILPAIMIFSLPISFLIGILIGISGLNGEYQITAIRSCGIPVRRLIRPLFIMGAFVGIATAFLSVEVLPKANKELRRLKETIILTQAPSELRPRVFNEYFPDYVLYLEDLTSDRENWSRVFLANKTDNKVSRIILAQSGTWFPDLPNQRLQLHLENGVIYTMDMDNPDKEASKFVFNSDDFPIFLDKSQDQEQSQSITKSVKDPPQKASEMSTSQLWRNAGKTDAVEKTEALVELNQRIGLPFAVFPFVLIGLTIGVSAAKGGRTSGFALSLLIVLLFYVLFINGYRLSSIGKISPWIGLWGADILLGLLGIYLLIKSERILKRSSLISMDRWRHFWGKIGTRYHLERIQAQITRFDNKVFQSISSTVRLLFPKIFDLYIAKGFLLFFFWSLAACSMLFSILTLFELLDDAIRNAIPVIEIVKYFLFYMPQILMLAIPISILLAILINFGILEKNSEVTAIKAGGVSLYRLSVPIFLLAAVFCVGLFLIQDYILPTANERQDRIWNTIKGRAPQTSMPQRKWILGDTGLIYNYEHFDENQDAFVGLDVYELDLNAAKMLRRIHVKRARIIRKNEWSLEGGWLRDYRLKQNSFRPITKETFAFPEQADYFKREIFQPKESSKMTYVELRSHINYLMKSGYNAIELEVELKKKVAFPISCLTMTLLAIPFSFIIGKRGAFFGIGASIAIAMFYMMLSVFFEAMGINGILNPFLAAWAPNILFGAAGFWMFLSTRT